MVDATTTYYIGQRVMVNTGGSAAAGIVAGYALLKDCCEYLIMFDNGFVGDVPEHDIECIRKPS